MVVPEEMSETYKDHTDTSSEDYYFKAIHQEVSLTNINQHHHYSSHPNNQNFSAISDDFNLLSLCVHPALLQSVGAFRHQPNDHPEHRHRVRPDADASRERQWQHGREYDLPEPSSGAHPEGVRPHLWDKRPPLIFLDREGSRRSSRSDKSQIVQRVSSLSVASCCKDNYRAKTTRTESCSS